MRISDWSSDVCSSDLEAQVAREALEIGPALEPILQRLGEQVELLRFGFALASRRLARPADRVARDRHRARARLRGAMRIAVRRHQRIATEQAGRSRGLGFRLDRKSTRLNSSP